MKVEIVEKRDNEVMVKYTGTSPFEATLLGMAALGPIEADVSLGSNSASYDKGSLTFHAFNLPIIEIMQKGDDK